jgi:hypothetical protein
LSRTDPLKPVESDVFENRKGRKQLITSYPNRTDCECRKDELCKLCPLRGTARPYVATSGRAMVQGLSSTEQSGPGGGPVQVIIHTGFAYDDDPGADKSITNAAAWETRTVPALTT